MTPLQLTRLQLLIIILPKKYVSFEIIIERNDFAEAREFWQNTKDPKAAVQKFPGRGPEKALLSAYIKSPENHKRAIQSVKKNYPIFF